MSATGPWSVSPNIEAKAACGATAAWIIVNVRTPDRIMIHRMFDTMVAI